MEAHSQAYTYVLGCCRTENRKRISDVDFCFFYNISQKTEVNTRQSPFSPANVKLYTRKIPPPANQPLFLRRACWGNRLHWYWPPKSQQPGETMQKNHKVQNAQKLTLTEAKWPELKYKPHKNKNLNEQCDVWSIHVQSPVHNRGMQHKLYNTQESQ